MEKYSTLMTGKEFQWQLQDQLTTTKQVVIISAYVSKAAVDWMLRQGKIDVTLVCRLRPIDIANKSTDISALIEAIKNGWMLYCLPSLHSKIYLLDNEFLFVGSANFTANGLNLLKNGNHESMLQVEASDYDKSYISKIIDFSYPLTVEKLEEIKNYIEPIKDSPVSYIPAQWPRSLEPENSLLLVTDFPLVQVGESCKTYEMNPSLPFAYLEFWADTVDMRREILINTNSFIWLVETLKKFENNRCYFGNLTQQLHSDIDEDPKPYRKEIKQLLRNLLTYVECYAKDEILVDRPNYSQRVQLISTVTYDKPNKP